ncbi:hypothetical protein TNCT_251261 [Trichonephila clavata]|uniref:Uncharacterized protein n=1 Tax=Trichonephila clavata TaxID=2740835 RepID=A0A8X6JPB4_TRICU|nr:hypothetical protein TNCT_251261 [Trichonephila clavata]
MIPQNERFPIHSRSSAGESNDCGDGAKERSPLYTVGAITLSLFGRWRISDWHIHASTSIAPLLRICLSLLAGGARDPLIETSFQLLPLLQIAPPFPPTLHPLFERHHLLLASVTFIRYRPKNAVVCLHLSSSLQPVSIPPLRTVSFLLLHLAPNAFCWESSPPHTLFSFLSFRLPLLSPQ